MFTVVPCILILPKFFIYQLMHKYYLSFAKVTVAKTISQIVRSLRRVIIPRHVEAFLM